MSKTAPEVCTVSLQEVQVILREVQNVVSPQKHAVLESLLESYVRITMALSERTATLARLRRTFGIHTTERLESSPRDDAPPPANDTADAPDARPESATDDEDATANAPTADGTAPAKKDAKKRNHGRTPASAYAASNTDVKHPELEPGHCCPECARGALYLFRKKAPVLQLVGQPVISAQSWTAETLRCPTCGTSFSPELPEEAQGPKYTNSAVVMIAYLHYVLGMPFERFEQLQDVLRVPVPASIQWKMMDEAGGKLVVLHQALKAAAAGAGLVHLDDTPMRILELMGKRRPAAIEAGLIEDPTRTGIYTTGVLTLGSQQPPVALFLTGVNHAGENLAALLDLRPPNLDKPVVMSDALNRNVPASVADRVIEANCMSHGRRGVFDQLESFPVEARYVLEELAKVFALDAQAKKDELTPAQRLELHQRNSGALLGRLRKWIRTQLDRERTIEPNSELGRALRYIVKHWRKLTLFLRRPGVPLTNNICERLLKVAIRYRKNSSFYKTLHGAEVGDRFMSLFQTARLNGVDPMAYLQAVLDNASEVAKAPERWLPWSYIEALREVSSAPEMPRPLAAVG